MAEGVRGILLLGLLLLTAGVHAEDRVKLDGARIIANDELAKILHVVPWKKAPATDVDAYPATAPRDEPLAPVTREDGARRLRYFKSSRARGERQPNQPAP